MPLPFPNIPNVPGVPALPRNPLGAAGGAALTLLVSDVVSTLLGTLAPKWGIYKDGVPAVIPDSIASFDYKQDWSLSNYPVEDGGFETYNKVNSPFEVRLRMSVGGALSVFDALSTLAAFGNPLSIIGSSNKRAIFLSILDAITTTTDVFDVVTPEAIYQNVNLTHYDYKRTASQGAGMIVADVWGLQVQNTASAAFSNTKSPSGAIPVGAGIVQAAPATPTQQSSIGRVVGGGV